MMTRQCPVCLQETDEVEQVSVFGECTACRDAYLDCLNTDSVGLEVTGYPDEENEDAEVS